MKVLIAVLAAFLALASVRTEQCDFTDMQKFEEQIGEDMMKCVLKEAPGLVMQVAEHMNNPDSMAKMDFICSHQQDLAKVLVCMKDDLIGCLPVESARDFVNEILTVERLTRVLSFMCSHQTELMAGDKCFDENAQMEFMTCYMGQLQQVASTFMSQSADINYKEVVCKVIGVEEACIKSKHGRCGKSYVDLIIQILEILFPMDDCPKVDYQSMMNNVASPFLVHGQPIGDGKPLRFQPAYVVKNGN